MSLVASRPRLTRLIPVPLLALGLLLASCLAPRALPGAWVVGRVDGTGYRGWPAWAVVTASVEDFHQGRFTVQQELPQDGPFSITQGSPPEGGFFVWLVQDTDGDGPDARDPHFPYSLTPIQGSRDRPRRITFSVAGSPFMDRSHPWAWLAWMANPWAGLGATGVCLAGILAFLGLARRGDRPGEEGLFSAPGARAGSRPGWRWGVVAALALAGALRVGLVVAEGCQTLGMTEAPYFAYAFPGPGAPTLGQTLLDPGFWTNRHPLLFVLLLKAIPSSDPCPHKLLQALISLVTLVPVTFLARFLASQARFHPDAVALCTVALLGVAQLAVGLSSSVSPHTLHLLLVALSLHGLGAALVHGSRRGAWLWGASTAVGILLFPIHAAFLGGQVLVMTGLVLLSRGGALVRRCLKAAVLILALTWLPSALLFAFLHRFARADALRVALFGFPTLPSGQILAHAAEVLTGAPVGVLGLAAAGLAFTVAGGVMLLRRAPLAAATVLVPGAVTLSGYLFAHFGAVLTADAVRSYIAHWMVGLLAVTEPLVAMAVVALGIRAIKALRGPWRGRWAGVGIGLLATVPMATRLAGTATLLADPGLPHLDAVAAVVRDQARAGDAVVSLTGLPHVSLVSRGVQGAGGRLGALAGPMERPDQPFEVLLSRPAVKRVWAFDIDETRFGRPKIDHERLVSWRTAWLSRSFVEVGRWKAPHVELVLYERPAP